MNKTQFSKQMSFYPHGTLVYFGCKKMAARCCRHASPNRTPDWQGVPGAHFFDRPGRLVYVSQIGANFEIHEFINSGWPKLCPRGSPPKRPFLKKKKTSFYPHGTHVSFALFFCWGPPVEYRRGCEWTFPRWCPAGLKRVLREFS